jgi:hypothetical protein
MVDPVITQYGICHDRRFIEEWFKTHDIDPITNKIVKNKSIFPVVFIKNNIEKWLTSL